MILETREVRNVVCIKIKSKILRIIYVLMKKCLSDVICIIKKAWTAWKLEILQADKHITVDPDLDHLREAREFSSRFHVKGICKT